MPAEAPESVAQPAASPTPPVAFLAPANVAHVARLARPEAHPLLAWMGTVRLTIDADGRYTASATDGRALGVLSGESAGTTSPAMPPAGDDLPSHGEAMIPARQLLAVTREARKNNAARLRIKLAALGESCRIDVSDRGRIETWRIDPESGRFPDAETVTPKGDPSATFACDAGLLSDVLAVCRDLGDGDANAVTLEIRPGDSTPLVVRCKGHGKGQTFLGLVMPMTVHRPSARAEGGAS
ncbi:MAG: hypothetical protein LC745_07420 [Planctomycetia bacterium]|nr:hypothetical protein [Planctomycetia bacterium]